MTEDKEIEKNLKDLDDICDECKEQHESVTQNLILTGFKICKSCSCLLYTSPSPRDKRQSRMPSSA